MANVSTGKKRIAILTGGGDVPGLNPAIRAVTIRALREGWEVIGLRRGWAGAIDIVREHDHDNSDNFQCLTEEIVNRAGRTGGTFLHTSRTRPSAVKADAVPDHLKDATMDSEAFGHGKGYKYAHDFKDHYVKQEYKPSDKVYYIPTNIGYEKKIKDWLENLKK